MEEPAVVAALNRLMPLLLGDEVLYKDKFYLLFVLVVVAHHLSIVALGLGISNTKTLGSIRIAHI